jgi:hypothetical protein
VVQVGRVVAPKTGVGDDEPGDDGGEAEDVERWCGRCWRRVGELEVFATEA